MEESKSADTAGVSKPAADEAIIAKDAAASTAPVDDPPEDVPDPDEDDLDDLDGGSAVHCDGRQAERHALT